MLPNDLVCREQRARPDRAILSCTRGVQPRSGSMGPAAGSEKPGCYGGSTAMSPPVAAPDGLFGASGTEAGTKRCRGGPLRLRQGLRYRSSTGGAGHLQGRRPRFHKAGSRRDHVEAVVVHLNHADFQSLSSAGSTAVAACNPSAAHAFGRWRRECAWPRWPHANSCRYPEPCAVSSGWRH
jgi:hypothetical protein